MGGRDLVSYFELVADLMLPFLRDRPLVLREPGRRRFVRQAPPDTPGFVAATGVTSPDTGKTVDYLLAQDRRSLLWLAERGHVEIHAWHSRTTSLGCPDYAFFDLDPSPGTSFEDVCEVALLVRREMEARRLSAFVKTSGLTGLQVYVPTRPDFTFTQVRDWTHAVCEKLHAARPDLTTLEWQVAARRGVYLDYQMMAPNKNAVAPFSPREGKAPPTISMPLSWKEVEAAPDPGDFTVDVSRERARRAWSHFRGVVDAPQRLPIRGKSHEVAHAAGPDWRHDGRRVRLRCVVGGWAPPEGESGEHMGSVLLGLYYLGELAYVGKAPVPREARHELYVRVAEHRAAASPFINLEGGVRGAHWAAPDLVCRVECSGLTGGPNLRAPRYLGLEAAADPHACKLEQLAA